MGIYFVELDSFCYYVLMTDQTLTILLTNEVATLECGASIARALHPRCGVIHLQGQLGAGKTTFSRGFLRELGYEGTVKSPTYTLVEPYHFDQFQVFHFDFYRINDPHELEYMGIRDYFTSDAICLIEWPEQAGESIPQSDLSCYLELHPEGRQIHFKAHSVLGNTILQKLKK